MKDYVVRYFPEFMGYDQLRTAVWEGWKAIPEEFLIQHLNTVPESRKGVIAASVKHTKY